jgi:hypothetical protein
VSLEGLGQLKNPTKSFGIEPEIVRFMGTKATTSEIFAEHTELFFSSVAY